MQNFATLIVFFTAVTAGNFPAVSFLTVTDQTSVIRFVEDNWLGGQRIGQGSFDGIASSISQMFSFTKMNRNGTLFLDPSTGEKQ